MTVNATLIHTTVSDINEAIEDGEFEQDGILHYDHTRPEADFEGQETFFFDNIISIIKNADNLIKIITEEDTWLFGINS